MRKICAALRIVEKNNVMAKIKISFNKLHIFMKMLTKSTPFCASILNYSDQKIVFEKNNHVFLIKMGAMITL